MVSDYFPPENRDSDEIPQVAIEKACKKCGLPAHIRFAGVETFCCPFGYVQWRLRITTKCKNCGEYTSYRAGGPVIEDGEYVRKTSGEQKSE